MKKIILFSLLTLFYYDIIGQEYLELIAEGTHTVQHISNVAEQHFESVGRDRGTGYKPFKRWQYFAQRTMDETGKLKSPEFYYNELESYNARINSQGANSRTTVGTWEEMGPTYWNATTGYNPGVGRITSIAVEEGNLNHIIVGSETGGVWRSMDGGSIWSVLTDNLSNIDVYALTIDPTDNTTYYWGSTNGVIFKSSDSGSTWSLHADIGSGTVNKILIDPTNTSKMYASLQSGGLFKSTNGGVNWTAIASGISTGYDFEFKPGDTDTIYASGTGFYVSTDGGLNFTLVPGSGANQFNSGPKMIGVSPNDANRVYVLEALNGVFEGIYMSSDSGNNFTKRFHFGRNYFGYDSNGLDNLGQAPRDMDIVINPNDADDVHIAGINTWRSTDAGINFSITSQWVVDEANNQGIGYCHADVDILLFMNDNVSSGSSVEKLFVGTDGGIYKAEDLSNLSSSYYTDLSPGLGIKQFYRIGVSQTDPVIITGGSQDNGTSALRSDGNWIDWWGADGMEGFIDKNNSQIFYGTSQFGAFVKTFDSGASVTGISQPDGKGGQNIYNWVVPFEQDNNTQNVIYCAFDEVYRSADGGNNWSSISQNFSNNIDHFKVAPSDSQKMYLAIYDDFYYSGNGGGLWIPSTLSLNGGKINEIAVHPNDPLKVAIATTNSEKVYLSTDGGGTWTSILWDLPNFSAQALAWQDNGDDGLYVGMNYGIYYTDNTLGNTWVPFNNGLPNVRINELEINTADDKIYAATYGRGLWRSSLYDSSLNVEDFKLSDFAIYPNPANDEVSINWDKTESVSIRIYDSQGKIVLHRKKISLFDGLKVNVSALNSGIYFVKLNTNLGEITKKLILE